MEIELNQCPCERCLERRIPGESKEETMVDNQFLISADIHEPSDLHNINTEDLLPLDNNLEISIQHQFSSIPSEIKPLNPIQYPDHWNKFPTLESIDTLYDFNVQIDRGENNNWLYHAEMSKVYIKLHSVMNVSLSYKPNKNDSKLFLRAMIVFSSADDMHLQVIRCKNHAMKTDKNRNVPESHILRCHHPNTSYCGDETRQVFGERLSLVVPLGLATYENGLCSEGIGLEFLCQSSCATGINRKPAAVVFTLENDRLDILGKRIMHFKVCSCPKRDMSKDDESILNMQKQKRDVPEEFYPGKGKRPNKTMRMDEDIKIEPPSSVSPDCNGQTTTPPLQLHLQTQPVIHSAQTTPNQTPSPPIIDGDQQSVTVTLKMPNRSSMLHVLRCAQNEIAGMVTREQPVDPSVYLKYGRKIEQFIDIYKDD